MSHLLRKNYPLLAECLIYTYALSPNKAKEWRKFWFPLLIDASYSLHYRGLVNVSYAL
jgi:hypothetical protein